MSQTSDATYALNVFTAAAGRHAGRALLARDEVFGLDEATQALEAVRIAKHAARDAGRRGQAQVARAEQVALEVGHAIRRRWYGPGAVVLGAEVAA